MRTDFPICPKCTQGRLVPLMFGEGKCDLACENKPDFSFQNLARHGVTYDTVRDAKWLANPGAAKWPVSAPLVYNGYLRVQSHPFKAVKRYAFVFDKTVRGVNQAGRRVRVEVGSASCSECAEMLVVSSGKAVAVLDPSDDAKMLWHPFGTITATLVLL